MHLSGTCHIVLFIYNFANIFIYSSSWHKADREAVRSGLYIDVNDKTCFLASFVGPNAQGHLQHVNWEQMLKVKVG
jgi:hypothetical protein